MAASTQNFAIGPNDGWVQVVTGPVVGFFIINHMPKHIPVHYTVSIGAPAANAPGIRVDDGEFWANGALPTGTGIYARINSSATDKVRVYAFQN